MAKPSLEFYKRALEKIPFKADEVLYIGDSIKLDMEPAISLGIETLIIDRDNFYPNLEKRISSLNEILEVTTKPIIYDADTGGMKEHFQFTVRTLERLGVSAVIIEDKIGLKKNSLFDLL